MNQPKSGKQCVTTRSLANRFYLPNAVSKLLSHGPIGYGVDCLDYYVAKQS